MSVTDMDDFHSIFEKVGHSTLSGLGEKEHLVADAVFTFLAAVNSQLNSSSLETDNLRDAVGEKGERVSSGIS